MDLPGELLSDDENDRARSLAEHVPDPASIFDEDNYCHFCGNAKWKPHAPSCIWRNAVEGSDADTFGVNPLTDPDVVKLLVGRVWGASAQIMVNAPCEPTEGDW